MLVPHAATSINGTTYAYDNAGNLTSAGSSTYAWDYANRLTDTNANGTTTHYLYDQSGQRVRQDGHQHEPKSKYRFF